MIEEIRTNRAEPNFDSLASGAEDGKSRRNIKWKSIRFPKTESAFSSRTFFSPRGSSADPNAKRGAPQIQSSGMSILGEHQQILSAQ